MRDFLAVIVTPFVPKVQAAGDQLIPPIVFSGITLYLSDISMQTKDLFGTGSASILSGKKTREKPAERLASRHQTCVEQTRFSLQCEAQLWAAVPNTA